MAGTRQRIKYHLWDAKKILFFAGLFQDVHLALKQWPKAELSLRPSTPEPSTPRTWAQPGSKISQSQRPTMAMMGPTPSPQAL